MPFPALMRRQICRIFLSCVQNITKSNPRVTSSLHCDIPVCCDVVLSIFVNTLCRGGVTDCIIVVPSLLLLSLSGAVI